MVSEVVQEVWKYGEITAAVGNVADREFGRKLAQVQAAIRVIHGGYKHSGQRGQTQDKCSVDNDRRRVFGYLQ